MDRIAAIVSALQNLWKRKHTSAFNADVYFRFHTRKSAWSHGNARCASDRTLNNSLCALIFNNSLVSSLVSSFTLSFVNNLTSAIVLSTSFVVGNGYTLF